MRGPLQWGSACLKHDTKLRTTRNFVDLLKKNWFEVKTKASSSAASEDRLICRWPDTLCYLGTLLYEDCRASFARTCFWRTHAYMLLAFPFIRTRCTHWHCARAPPQTRISTARCAHKGKP